MVLTNTFAVVTTAHAVVSRGTGMKTGTDLSHTFPVQVEEELRVTVETAIDS